MTEGEVFEVGAPGEAQEDRSQRTLWRAVVAQAIRDLGATDAPVALEAAEWMDSVDYHTCCDLAGIEPQWLLREVGRVQGLAPIYRAAMTRKLALVINSATTCVDGILDISYSRERRGF